MRRRTPPPPSPLPQRDGVDPVRLRLPAEGPWATVRDHLVERLSGAVPGAVAEMFDAGLVVGADGRPVAADAPYRPGMFVWFHRDLPPEVPVPFPLVVHYRDEHIVVADKPHFLATTPRGSHVTQTALARLRRELGVPTLSAAHRLDRLTAGLVLFTVRPEERGAYQTLFRDRRIHKTYEAVAPYAPALALPRTVRSRIVKERGVLTAQETEGEPNAVSHIELIDRRRWPTTAPAPAPAPSAEPEPEPGLAPSPGPATSPPPTPPSPPTAPTTELARYRLTPTTGQTHQLRVHMTALGVPILGDPLYPEVTAPVPADDFRRPLQLLARELAFTDPLTGREHRFRSARTLTAWASYPDWAAGGGARPAGQ
ncbi:RluA family pseudouridine synthase [Streptomyces sp. NPDC023723]|uniref:RluA family pseudouridine synthase n=1 Tax=Streptomyces sp. NPDC023723 TaxID=3154323 RepID=UPI0033E9D86D